MTRVGLTAGERERLHTTFTALCAIPSPTGRERAVADWLTADLSALGLAVEEDGAGAQVGSDAGNLLVRIPGADPDRWMLMAAHMDTVPPVAPIEPVLRDDGYENAHAGILGADNKAAVAALVELARGLAGTRPPIGVELLFTIAEETGLHGAKAIDPAALRSRFGYVFDHATPLGEVIVASPTYMRLVATVHGRAAHAGLHPEQGLNAIVCAARAIVGLPQGRLDPETTANVGLIHGGSATNVVPDHCRIEAEVRGIDPARVDTVVTACVDTIQDAADGAGADVDIALEKMFSGYRVRPAEPGLALAEAALSEIGYSPRRISSGGGSDANALRLGGIEVINLANGTERAHERTERVSLGALDDGLALARTLVERAGASL